MRSRKRTCLFFLHFILCVFAATAQDTVSSDGLFQAARKAAFDEKNYPKAKAYLYKALDRSPDYADIRIFLGRIYSWTNHYDSARTCFERVLAKDPANEDAALAYTDLEYWNDHETKALEICEAALVHHPGSKDLLLRKAKIQNALRKFEAADATVQQLLKMDKNNSEVRSLANRIKESSSKNKIGITYDYVTFDKQFSDPWHLVSVDYGRTTSFGSVIGRVNYANRFKENGLQFEAEAYPRISKMFYSYVNLGYSDNVGVFPQWRGGLSLYANLPKSFEGEIGVRYLKFTGSPTWIYTTYLGKYYKSWLFSARAYITPSDYTKTVSASYNASARYYYGSADDLVGATIGYGISPDDRSNAIQLDNPVKLTSYRVGLFYKKKIAKMNVLSLDVTWFNQEYLPQTKGNQYQISIGWLHRF